MSRWPGHAACISAVLPCSRQPQKTQMQGLIPNCKHAVQLCMTEHKYASATCPRHRSHSQGARVLAEVLFEGLACAHLCTCCVDICLMVNQCLGNIHVTLTCSRHQGGPILHTLVFMLIITTDNIQCLHDIATLQRNVNFDCHTRCTQVGL